MKHLQDLALLIALAAWYFAVLALTLMFFYLLPIDTQPVGLFAPELSPPLAQIDPAPVETRALAPAAVAGTEARIATIWTKILGVTGIGSNDNFFDLGGHSLLAVQAHRELREEFSAARLSITDIFAAPTLKAIAGTVERRLGTNAKPATAQPDAAPEKRSEAMSKRRAMRARREVELG